MLRYAEKVLLPLVKKKREAMGLDEGHPCLTIFDVFGGQQTLAFTLMCLLIALTSCNPLIFQLISLKKKHLYTEEVQKQLTSGTAISDVKIDTCTSIPA